MKHDTLVAALLDKFPEHMAELQALSNADLLAVTGELAAKTSRTWSTGTSHVLYEVPREIVRRGAKMISLLEGEAARLIKQKDPPQDHAALIVAPLAILLAASGRVLDERFDGVLGPSLERRTVGLAEALRTLPMERRLALLQPHLHPGAGRWRTPYELLEVCPHPEIVRFTAATVAAWKRDRDEMTRGLALRRLAPVTRAFAIEALPSLLEALGEDLGPYRAPFVRALGAAADATAVAPLLEALGDKKQEVVDAASEALLELAARLPEEVRSALEVAAKTRGTKAKQAARVLSALRPSEAGAPESPLERLSHLRLSFPRERVEAVLKFYQNAPYHEPFAWEKLKDDEPALLVGLVEWNKVFFPIQGRISRDLWFNRRWRDPFHYLGREGGPLRELAPWAAAEAFGQVRDAEVTVDLLFAYDHAFGEAGLTPLAEALRRDKLVGRQHLLEHLYLSLPSQNLDLFLEAAADKSQAVAKVGKQVIAGFGPPNVPSLIALLRADRKAVRLGAAEVLGRIAAPEAAEALEQAAASEKAADVKRAFQAALTACRSSAAR